MNNLIEPTEKYIHVIENSKNYLNCPKHFLNHDLDCLFRQGIVIDEGTAINYIYEYLKKYDIQNPLKTASNFVKWRKTISTQKFNKINVNPYIDNIPKHIKVKHKHICEWTDKNTTYYHGAYGGGIKNIPSYPFKYK